MDIDKIYRGDCFELVKQIPDESIDLILTDPPYGITQNKWDVKIDCKAFMDECLRVAKKHAAILVFSQMPFAADLVQAARKFYRYEWVLEKANATGHANAKKMPMKAHENLHVFYQALPKYNPQMVDGKPFKRTCGRDSLNYREGLNRAGVYFYDGRRYPRDVLKIPWRRSFGKTVHPTQKPVAACEYFIKTYSNEGDTVLDLFLGSGTTAVAAVNLGRHFIGFEQEREYFEIAQRRIREAQEARASSLFAENR